MQYMHIHYTTNILQKIKIDCYTYIKKTIYGETRDKKEQKNNIEWSREKNPGTTK